MDALGAWRSHRGEEGGEVSAIRVLGACGVLSAALSTASGFLNMPVFLGIAGAIMLFGNVYAVVYERAKK